MGRLFTTLPLSIQDVKVAPTHYMKPLRERRIRFIFLHATGASAGHSSVPWLAGRARPPVSAHRVIDRDGTIYKLVSDANIAFTQGRGSMGGRGPEHENLNIDGLSIELENENRRRPPYEEYPAPQLKACAAQIVEWIGAYGWLPILYHSDVDAEKHDPSGLPREVLDAYIARLIGQYVG